jgi:hypothetical protein
VSGLVIKAPSAAQVFNYYISPTGSDSNDGLTTSTPWAITALNTKRATYAGSSVGLMDGTYDISASGAWDGDNTGGAKAVFQLGAGSSGSQTVIGAVNPRLAIIKMKSGGGTRNTNKIAAMGIYVNDGTTSGYVTVDGLWFTGGAWFYLYYQAATTPYMPGLVVKNCKFDDRAFNSQTGSTDNCPAVYLVNTDGALIQNCKFADLTDINGTSNGACALMTFGTKNTVFELNEVYNTSSAVYDKHHTVSGYPNQGTICRYNYVHDLALQAFYGFGNANATEGTPPFPDYEIHHNLAKNTLGFLTQEVSIPSRSIYQVYNNTLINAHDSGNGCILTPVDSTSHKAKIYNNILVRTSAVGFQGDIAVSTTGVSVLDYNVYNAAAFRAVIMTPINSFSGLTTFNLYTSLSAWRTGLGADSGATTTNVETNGTTTTAVFVGSTTPADYQLSSGGGKSGGKIGGTSGGTTIDCGCWGAKSDGSSVSQIGCSF